MFEFLIRNLDKPCLLTFELVHLCNDFCVVFFLFQHVPKSFIFLEHKVTPGVACGTSGFSCVTEVHKTVFYLLRGLSDLSEGLQLIFQLFDSIL